MGRKESNQTNKQTNKNLWTEKETYIFSPACPSLSLSVPSNFAALSKTEAERKNQIKSNHSGQRVYLQQQ